MPIFETGVVTTHISPAKGYGGPAVSIAVLIKSWRADGHCIGLCTSDASIAGRLKISDIKLGDVETYLYHSYGFKRWGFGPGAILAICRLCSRADKVYINGIATWPTTLAAIICKIMRRPYVVALRGGMMPEHVAMIRGKKYHKWLYYRLLTFPFLKWSTGIHCTTNIESDAARNVLGMNVRIRVIPNGIYLKDVTPSDVPTGDGLTICYIGRIAQEKGINGFIEAWLRCKRSQDKLIVAGSGTGDYFKRFISLVDHAAGGISYRGYLGEPGVTDAIRQSHFLVLPSGLEASDVRENFGNTVAEALALGRPVMVSRGLSWDHIENKHIGFLFDRNNASVCRTIIRAQNTTEQETREMGISARQYAVQHLDASCLAEKLWGIINTGS